MMYSVTENPNHIVSQVLWSSVLQCAKNGATNLKNGYDIKTNYHNVELSLPELNNSAQITRH
jgi:hypothetical protein